MQSKILQYLEIPDNVAADFPSDVKEFIRLIDGSQELYSQAPEGAKKDALAQLIVGWMRSLLEYLKGLDLGLYAARNVNKEKSELPQEENVPNQPESKYQEKPETEAEQKRKEQKERETEETAAQERASTAEKEETGEQGPSMPTPSEPSAPQPQQKAATQGKQKPSKPQPKPSSEGKPEQQPEQKEEDFTIEDLQNAIEGLEVLADMGDQEAKESVEALKILLEMYS